MVYAFLCGSGNCLQRADMGKNAFSNNGFYIIITYYYTKK
jgi:hypothetical protein